ncbi:MAG: T9SS type A sorting domain-containing protein [Saprospiraceae bacterium]
MKNLRFTLVFCLATGFAYAQQLPFTVIPNPSHVISPPSEFDSYSKDTRVVNLTNAPLNVQWERVIISVPQGMQTQVCDPNLCYLPTVNSQEFTLQPNDTAELFVHFLNFSGQSGVAEVHIVLTNKDNPSDVFTAIYTYDSTVSTGEGFDPSAVLLAPNPASDYFLLTDDARIEHVRVYSRDGRPAAAYRAMPGQRYEIGALPQGMYFVALFDRDNRFVRAVELIKQ